MQRRGTSFLKPLFTLAYSLLFTLCLPSLGFAEELELLQKLQDIRPAVEQEKNTNDDLSALKSNLKLEIIRELRADENVALPKSPSRPRLNFLELAGYFRTRGNLLGQCDLGTYIPSLGIGSSNCSPSLSYFSKPSTDTVNGGTWLFSGDLRFRLESTLNVSEDIRILGRVDFLDNIVMGSSSDYMTDKATPNPSFPISFLAQNQLSPLAGLNSDFGPVSIKQLWGEVTFPYGELKFGRLPLGFGLGILYQKGNDITQDFGNNVDGALFETRVLGHQLTSGFTISYSGPWGRGGGLGTNGDGNSRWLFAEGGSRLDLDISDNVYNLHFIFESDKTEDSSWKYGALGTYRFQLNDSMYTKMSNDSVSQLRQVVEKRNAHLGLFSLWSLLKTGALVVEGEIAGKFGVIADGKGLWNDPNKNDKIWIYQGGVALQSRYGFMQNRLQVGLDAGWASGDPAPGFGIRTGLNKAPADGAVDGQQINGSDDSITNFVFDRDYHVDLVLFREVLGSVTDALYLKPHISYFFTEGFGIRGDVVGSMSNFARSTPGNSNWLGVELDASMFFRTTDGFNLNIQYGHLFPFDGLNLDQSVVLPANTSFTRAAKSASALKFLAGITF